MLGDVRPLVDLHIRIWQWAYRGLLPDEFLDSMPDSRDRREAWWRQTLQAPKAPTRTWIADLDRAVAGFCHTGPSRDPDTLERTGEVWGLYVDPRLGRRGIGRLLLLHGVDDLRARGFRDLTLWVLETNQRARRFYEALGWSPDGTTKRE